MCGRCTRQSDRSQYYRNGMKENAKLKLTSLTLLCNRSKASRITTGKSAFSSLLSRAWYRYASSDLVLPTWLQSTRCIRRPFGFDSVTIKSAPILMSGAPIELFPVNVKWAIGWNIGTRWCTAILVREIERSSILKISKSYLRILF